MNKIVFENWKYGLVLRHCVHVIPRVGIVLIYRNTNTVRYWRLLLSYGKASFEFDFFRKDKLMDKWKHEEENAKRTGQ